MLCLSQFCLLMSCVQSRIVPLTPSRPTSELPCRCEIGARYVTAEKPLSMWNNGKQSICSEWGCRKKRNQQRTSIECCQSVGEPDLYTVFAPLASWSGWFSENWTMFLTRSYYRELNSLNPSHSGGPAWDLCTVVNGETQICLGSCFNRAMNYTINELHMK